MEKRELYVDPRTKLFLLLTMNIVLLNTSSGVLLPYLRFIIGFLPFVMLLTAGRYKPAWVYLTIYLTSHGVCAGLYQWIIDDAIRISGINGYEVRTGRNAGSVFLLQYKNK